MVIRVASLLAVRREPLEGDAASYFQTAHDLLAGGAFEPHWPPGLPAVLMLAFSALGEKEIVARGVMLLVYLAFSLALLAAGPRVVGRRATILALAVCALKPNHVWISISPLTQLPTAALALGAIHFADRVRREASWRATAALGLCLAGMALTRPSALSVVVLLPAYLLWKTKTTRALVVPLGIASLLVGLWCAKAYTLAGRFVFINNANSQNVFYGNNPDTPVYRTWWFGSHKEPGEAPERFLQVMEEMKAREPRERDRLYMKMALDHIRAEPALFLRRTAARVRTTFTYNTFAGAQVAKIDKRFGLFTLAVDAGTFLLLTGMALLYPITRWRRGDAGEHERVLLLLMIAALYAVPYFLVFSHPTFHTTTTTLLGLLGCAAAVTLLEDGWRATWEKVGERGRWWVGGAVFFYLALQAEWTVDVLSRAG